MPTLVIGVLELQLDKQGIYCRAAVLDHIIESVSDIVAATFGDCVIGPNSEAWSTTALQFC